MLFVNVLVPIFLIVTCGILIQKYSKIDMGTLTKVSLFICVPALVFTALIKNQLEFSVSGSIALFMVLYTLALWGIAVLCARLLGFDQDSGRALVLTTSMMNVGNFGLPLVYFAFGDKALAYSVMTFVVFNIPLGTLAVYLAQGAQTDWRQALQNVGRNPIFHGVLASFVFQITGIPHPAWFLRPLDLLGQAAIPLLLLLLGAQLAQTRWQASAGFLSLSAFIRLGLAPVLAMSLCYLFGIDGLLRKVLVLQTSTPSAILPLVYALHYKTRPDLVAGGITLSTLLSAASLTILLYVL